MVHKEEICLVHFRVRLPREKSASDTFLLKKYRLEFIEYSNRRRPINVRLYRVTRNCCNIKKNFDAKFYGKFESLFLITINKQHQRYY